MSTESFNRRWWCFGCFGWRPRAGFGTVRGVLCCRACIEKREKAAA